MHPPLSMIFFTTLAGAGQGLWLALFGVDLAAALGLAEAPAVWRLCGAALVLLLCGAGLVAATFHLGHPLRAWRAVAMWRTSWLSREVIALPAFMAVVALWAGLHVMQAGSAATLGVGALGVALALALYVCTGMIYAAVKAIREWAHPLTPLNYTVLGLASGLLLAAALAAATAPGLAVPLAQAALLATVVGAVTRGLALRRNLALVPKTTLQTAIGIRHPRIEQISQGAMGGSFNTREFFHQRTPGFVRGMRWAAAILGFALPVLLLLLSTPAPGVLVAAFVLQYLGLLAERWCFFAEGQHPQNLYYRRVG
ncbi:MAG: dimethyl sulfoxide reductase anchor subunit [Proteobacteria bacterium]|nr:dimethyl sulfoxide reductase anchor subunit [Pseudomonadota bacterium]